MLNIIKEVRNATIHHTMIDHIRVDDSNFFEFISRNFKPTEINLASRATAMLLKFFEPENLYIFTDKKIHDISKRYKGFDKLVGCWPFDFIDVVRDTQTMEELRSGYNIHGFRLIVFMD